VRTANVEKTESVRKSVQIARVKKVNVLAFQKGLASVNKLSLYS